MKIKTITCHDVYNVGASLQAYALSTFLQSLGNEVEIINYKPDYLIHYKLTGVNNPKYDVPIIKQLYLIAKFPMRLKRRYEKRKKEFDYFTSHYLNVTSMTYSTNQELKENLLEADVYFAGSDQIWNTFFQNGKDPAFYLDFVGNKGIKASYAASFATEKIDTNYKEKIKGWINHLDYVSVRESSGLRILNDLGIDGGVQVLDPVFLLNEEKWVSIEKNLNINEKYILIYDFDMNPNIMDYARKLAKENNWEIYSVLKNKECDKSFENEGPLSFIYLIRNAQFIISNSFHATAFSIIFRKNFVVFNRNESINTRMKDLLLMFGLEERIVTKNNSINISVDYKQVNENIENKIQESKKYIETVLESVSK